MKNYAALSMAILVLAAFASASITVKFHFPPNSGRTDFSQTADASCGQAEKCFRQAASLGGTNYPATGFFACPGHPEVTQNFLAEAVNGVIANYTRDSAYWDFAAGGASATVGMSCYFVSDGDAIELNYNGAYTGPVISDAPASASGTPGLLQGNACINAYQAAWPDEQWPQICGKKSDWAWLEKNGWVRPFTGYSAGKTAGLQAENKSDEKTATGPQAENKSYAPSTSPEQNAGQMKIAATPGTPPKAPVARKSSFPAKAPNAQSAISYPKPIGAISGPLGIPKSNAAGIISGDADIPQKEAVLAAALPPRTEANPQSESPKPATGFATAGTAPASAGMFFLLAIAGALCLKKLWA
ncbi:hypothetical protein HY995_01715 [Candidatus Micrarchaeota archaeon]|nr:hypothetical protein [Candidatus Micrarchaeota archaeon]